MPRFPFQRRLYVRMSSYSPFLWLNIIFFVIFIIYHHFICTMVSIFCSFLWFYLIHSFSDMMIMTNIKEITQWKLTEQNHWNVRAKDHIKYFFIELDFLLLWSPFGINETFFSLAVFERENHIYRDWFKVRNIFFNIAPNKIYSIESCRSRTTEYHKQKSIKNGLKENRIIVIFLVQAEHMNLWLASSIPNILS